MSINEVIGYGLLLAAVWQGSGLASQAAAILGAWLEEPHGTPAPVDEI